MKRYIPEATEAWRTRVVNNTVYQFVGFNRGVETFFEKEGTSEKECFEMDDWGFPVHFLLRFQENSIDTSSQNNKLCLNRLKPRFWNFYWFSPSINRVIF